MRGRLPSLRCNHSRRQIPTLGVGSSRDKKQEAVETRNKVMYHKRKDLDAERVAGINAALVRNEESVNETGTVLLKCMSNIWYNGR